LPGNHSLSLVPHPCHPLAPCYLALNPFYREALASPSLAPKRCGEPRTIKDRREKERDVGKGEREKRGQRLRPYLVRYQPPPPSASVPSPSPSFSLPAPLRPLHPRRYVLLVVLPRRLSPREWIDTRRGGCNDGVRDSICRNKIISLLLPFSFPTVTILSARSLMTRHECEVWQPSIARNYFPLDIVHRPSTMFRDSKAEIQRLTTMRFLKNETFR